MFVGFFLLVTLLTNFLMRNDYKNTNYEIKVENPVIAVTECKSAYGNGYIKGNVTNNTEKIINLKYLQINLYNKDNVYLGSEYKELKKFYPKETNSFKLFLVILADFWFLAENRHFSNSNRRFTIYQ